MNYFLACFTSLPKLHLIILRSSHFDSQSITQGCCSSGHNEENALNPCIATWLATHRITITNCMSSFLALPSSLSYILHRIHEKAVSLTRCEYASYLQYLAAKSLPIAFVAHTN